MEACLVRGISMDEIEVDLNDMNISQSYERQTQKKAYLLKDNNFFFERGQNDDNCVPLYHFNSFYNLLHIYVIGIIIFFLLNVTSVFKIDCKN